MSKNDEENIPDWLNSGGDRDTPYTDEEIETFATGFIQGLSDREWSLMKSKYGEKEARENIKAGFTALGEENLGLKAVKNSLH